MSASFIRRICYSFGVMATLTISSQSHAISIENHTLTKSRTSRIDDLSHKILFSTILMVDSLNTVSNQFKEYLKQEESDREAIQKALLEVGVAIASDGIVSSSLSLINNISPNRSIAAHAAAAKAQSVIKSTTGKAVLEQTKKQVARYLEMQMATRGENSAIDTFFDYIKDLLIQGNIVLSAQLRSMTETELEAVEEEYNSKNIRISKYKAVAWNLIERYKREVLPISYTNSRFLARSEAIKAFSFQVNGTEQLALIQMIEQGGRSMAEKLPEPPTVYACIFLTWVSDELTSATKHKMKKIFNEEPSQFSYRQRYRIPGIFFDSEMSCPPLQNAPEAITRHNGIHLSQ